MANTNGIRVVEKTRTYRGVTTPARDTEFLIVIAPHKQSITVYREDQEGQVTDIRTFHVGDAASWGAYNITYIGTITKISDKVVSITQSRRTIMGENVKIHRLSMYEFCWRNYRFNEERARRENSIEMMNH